MTFLSSWLASPPPDAAVEITPTRVSAATMTTRGGELIVPSFASERLAPEVIHAALISTNVADPAAVAAAVRSAIDRLGTRPTRVALVVPDLAARVSVVRFDRVPARRDDLDQLVRWQLRKAAPFPVEEASVSYTAGASLPDGGREFVVAVARRDVIAEYEAACVAAGVQAGIVDIATFSVLNLVLAAPRAAEGDFLLVHMRPEYTSVAIVRRGDLIFFRNRAEGEDDSLTDVVHQTAMYYQDRLAGAGFRRILMSGSGRAADIAAEARYTLEARLGVVVETVDPTPVVPSVEGMRRPGDVLDVLPALAGMLIRTHREAVHA